MVLLATGSLEASTTSPTRNVHYDTSSSWELPSSQDHLVHLRTVLTTTEFFPIFTMISRLLCVIHYSFFCSLVPTQNNLIPPPCGTEICEDSSHDRLLPWAVPFPDEQFLFLKTFFLGHHSPSVLSSQSLPIVFVGVLLSVGSISVEKRSQCRQWKCLRKTEGKEWKAQRGGESLS